MKPIFSFRLSGLPKVTEGNAIVLAATAAVPLALMKVRRLVDELGDVSFMSCGKFGREWGFWQFRVFLKRLCPLLWIISFKRLRRLL
jgi:hypothetical protein